MTHAVIRQRNVRPDSPDFRDLPFRPNIAVAPQPELFPAFTLNIKNQHDRRGNIAVYALFHGATL